MAFKKRTNFTTRNFVRFEKQIKHLAASIGVDKKTFILPHYSRGGVDYSVNSEMRKKYGKNFSFPEEIKELDRLNNNVMRSTDQLTRINSFMDNLKQVMNYTPSLWPVAGGGFITSRYGYRASPFTGVSSLHTGVDIAWWPGSNIKSTAAGVVRSVGFMGGYGLCVVITHRYGFTTRYAHMQAARVSVGSTVRKGQIIGTMGNTGRTTGYHLHYEVILGNSPIDPHPYLASKF